MNYRGKLIGFLVGFWLGHVVGALLGLWMGHLYDRGLQQQTRFSFARRPGRGTPLFVQHDRLRRHPGGATGKRIFTDVGHSGRRRARTAGAGA